MVKMIQGDDGAIRFASNDLQVLSTGVIQVKVLTVHD